MILHKKQRLPPEKVNTIIEIAGLPGTGKSEIANALAIVYGFPIIEFPMLSPVSFTGKALLATLKDTRAIASTVQGRRWWACQSMSNFLEKYNELTVESPVFVTNYYFNFKSLFGQQAHGLFKACPMSSKCYILLHKFSQDNSFDVHLPIDMVKKMELSLKQTPDDRLKRVTPNYLKGCSDNKKKNAMLNFIREDLERVYRFTPIREFEF